MKTAWIYYAKLDFAQKLRYSEIKKIHSEYGRKLLAYVLKDRGQSADLKLERNAYGKPFLNSELSFNLSHAHQYVICAASFNDSVGVDIEQIKERQLEPFASKFGAGEWSAINSHSKPLARFYQLWCIKEAVLKAYGTGFCYGYNKIEINGKKVSIANEFTGYINRVLVDPAYELCLVTKNEVKVVVEQVASLQLN